MAGYLPPGWPDDVRPPGTPEWTRSAVAWMLDLCPPDYRAHEVLIRHPIVLARVAVHHVQAGIAAARTGLSTARQELGDVVDVPTVEAAVEVYEREAARLIRSDRALALVEQALRGGHFRARL